MPQNPSRMNRLLFFMLFAAWMLPGLVGRDPWKADEAYSFGLVLNMIETGDWVVPTLGADPFMEKPPIFYIVAGLFGKALSPLLPLHDAVRGACVLFNLLAIGCVAMASREVNGRGTGWLAAIMLLGCLGWVHNAHMLMTDNALLAGFAMAVWGMLLGRKKPWVGGLLCGTGSGLAFLSKGLLGPGVLGIVALGLPLLDPVWRWRKYFCFLGAILLAVVPWVSIWPFLLYQRSPKLFMDWFWDNNFGRFLGTSALVTETQRPFFFVQKLPYFALPVFPLALWTLWRRRANILRQPALVLPLWIFLATLFVLSVARQAREVYALPMLIPLSLLAVPGLSELPTRITKFAHVILVSVFSVAAGAAWLAWIAQFNARTSLVEKIQAKIPGYTPSVYLGFLVMALLLSLGWLLLAKGRLWPQISPEIRLESERPGSGTPEVIETAAIPKDFQLVSLWTAGIALICGLGMTLWLPVTNANMTYRNDFAGLRETLGKTPGIVGSKNLGEPQRALLHYYAGLKTWRVETRSATNWHWFLVQGEDVPGKKPQPLDSTWRMAWEGHHHRELFRLYRQ